MKGKRRCRTVDKKAAKPSKFLSRGGKKFGGSEKGGQGLLDRDAPKGVKRKRVRVGLSGVGNRTLD